MDHGVLTIFETPSDVFMGISGLFPAVFDISRSWYSSSSSMFMATKPVTFDEGSGCFKICKYILHNLKKVSSCVCGDLGISMPCLWQQNWILVTSEHAMFLRRSWDNFHLCLWCPKKRIQGKTLSFSNLIKCLFCLKSARAWAKCCHNVK